LDTVLSLRISVFQSLYGLTRHLAMQELLDEVVSHRR
jgi:hypothetical protein